MPIAHNPHLAGCLGAPVRDPIADSAARYSHDNISGNFFLTSGSEMWDEVFVEFADFVTEFCGIYPSFG